MLNDINKLRQSLCEDVIFNLLEAEDKKISLIRKVYDKGIGNTPSVMGMLIKGTGIGAVSGLLNTFIKAINNPVFKLRHDFLRLTYGRAMKMSTAPLNYFEKYLNEFWELLGKYIEPGDIVVGALLGFIITMVTILTYASSRKESNRNKLVETKIKKGSEKIPPDKKKILDGLLKINDKLLKKYKL